MNGNRSNRSTVLEKVWFYHRTSTTVKTHRKLGKLMALFVSIRPDFVWITEDKAQSPRWWPKEVQSSASKCKSNTRRSLPTHLPGNVWQYQRKASWDWYAKVEWKWLLKMIAKKRQTKLSTRAAVCLVAWASCRSSSYSGSYLNF